MLLAIRKIASIRQFLFDSFTAKIVSSHITSRMDYCNATFACVANVQIVRLPKKQTNKQTRNNNRITPLGLSRKDRSVIMSHWLPVKYRI